MLLRFRQSTTTSTHELNDFNKYFNLKIYGTSTIARLNNSGQAGNDGTFLASYLGSLSPKNARDCARIEELIGALSEFELGKIKATDLASKALGFENVKLESGKGEVKINNFVTNKDELKLAKGKAQHTPAPVPLGNAKV